LGLSEYVYEKVLFFLVFSLEILKNEFNIFLYRKSIKRKTPFLSIFFVKNPVFHPFNV